MTTLDVVRETVGRRWRISREEMTLILQRLQAGGLDLRNIYVTGTLDLSVRGGDGEGHPTSPSAAQAWTALVRGITCISVDARGSLRDGYVRYDQPGTMHPLQMAELTFAGPELASSLPYLRRHADRVLVVADA